MDDAALVRRLAIEKLEAKAAELRSSWAWAKPMLDPDYGFTAEYRRVHPKPARTSPGNCRGDLASRAAPGGTRRHRRGRLDRRADGRSRAARGTPRRARPDRGRPGSLCGSRPRRRRLYRHDRRSTASSGSTKVLSNAPPRASKTVPICPRPTDDRGLRTIGSAMSEDEQASGPTLTARAELCARNAASARCWSTISRHTGCRSRRRIWRRISRWLSIWRSIRCASTCSNSATGRVRSI